MQYLIRPCVPHVQPNKYIPLWSDNYSFLGFAVNLYMSSKLYTDHIIICAGSSLYFQLRDEEQSRFQPFAKIRVPTPGIFDKHLLFVETF